MEILGFVGVGVLLLGLAWVLGSLVKKAERNMGSTHGGDFTGPYSDCW
jgi:hypothetical protein